LKNSLVRRVLANVCDFDMENLFPPPTPIEDMEEAAEGAYDLQPSKTLRRRDYGPMPLIVKPEYSGDFLEKLRSGVYAANSENLWDFSMPSEWLKHQESPHPREILDWYYDINRPGPDVGQKTLQEYNDRGWDDTDAPEMSEDKINRMYRAPVVVANWLMETMPIEGTIDLRSPRVAKLLNDLEKTSLTTKLKGKRKPDSSGVTVRLSRAEPSRGRWTFKTTSGKDVYTTVFQFIPSGTVRDVDRLNVRVSCTCPSWLFWGAQYNAVMGDYLYGKIVPKFVPPVKRDPKREFLVCKHVLACIPLVSRYRTSPVTVTLKKRLQKEPEYEVDTKGFKEKLRIPDDLKYVVSEPDIKDAIKKWDTWSLARRKKFIMGLDDVDKISFMAHRFPKTATGFVVNKLKDIAIKGSPEQKIKAKKALEIIT